MLFKCATDKTDNMFRPLLQTDAPTLVQQGAAAGSAPVPAAATSLPAGLSASLNPWTDMPSEEEMNQQVSSWGFDVTSLAQGYPRTTKWDKQKL